MPAKMYETNAYQDDEFIMQGVIDLLIVKKNELILLDYKTGKLTDDKIKTYAYQLGAYADVCERVFNKKVTHQYLCFIDEQKIIEI